MSDYEFTMSPRIRHPHIEPAEITRNLGIARDELRLQSLPESLSILGRLALTMALDVNSSERIRRHYA